MFVAHVTLGSGVLYYIVVIWCEACSLGSHAVLKCLSDRFSCVVVSPLVHMSVLELTADRTHIFTLWFVVLRVYSVCLHVSV